MPSSKLSRSPARTLSAIGFKRLSVIVSSLISNPSRISNAPNRSRRAPKQQEQHTNIAVHGEKRSVQLAEIVSLDEGMFVSKKRRNHGDSCPSRPVQTKAERQPPEKSYHPKMHQSRDRQRVRDSKLFRNGEEPGLLIVIHVLAGIEHVKASDPQRDRGAKNQHAQVEPAGNGDPRRRWRNAQRKPKKKMRPIREALRERVEKENRNR